MTCEEALARLDDLVDGQLGEAEFQEIELHLTTCDACRQRASELRTLVSRTAALPHELTPEKELWPGIAGRIQASRRFAPGRMDWSWTWRGLAAAAVLILAVLWWRGGHHVPPSLAPGDDARRAALAVDQDYERAAAELLVAVAARRERLTPESQARIDESLRVIAQALTAIRVELAKDPSDPALNHLLLSVHQKRIEVLRTLVQLTA